MGFILITALVQSKLRLKKVFVVKICTFNTVNRLQRLCNILKKFLHILATEKITKQINNQKEISNEILTHFNGYCCDTFNQL